MTELVSTGITYGLLSILPAIAVEDRSNVSTAAQRGVQVRRGVAQAVKKAAAEAGRAAKADSPKRVKDAGGDNRAPGLSECVWDLLSDVAVRLLSGNKAELLSGNEPELLSENEAELLSGNEAELLSGNEAELLSGNSAELLSGNEADLLSDNEVGFCSGNEVSLFSGFSISIRFENSGNTTPEKGAARKAAFRTLDRDQDDRLTFEEFQGFQQGKKARKLRKRFAGFDEDNDGYLTSAELQPARAKKNK
jgi:hypothetical protein